LPGIIKICNNFESWLISIKCCCFGIIIDFMLLCLQWHCMWGWEICSFSHCTKWDVNIQYRLHPYFSNQFKSINTCFPMTGVRILQTVQASWWITHPSPAIEYPIPMEQQLLPAAPMVMCIMWTQEKPITLSGYAWTAVVSTAYYYFMLQPLLECALLHI
jgi:hypothetical protein